MKIISKYKDYYDYLIGINGIDELVVYERNTEVEGYNGKFRKEGFNPFDCLTEPINCFGKIDTTRRTNITLVVCGNTFTFYRKGNQFVYEEPSSEKKLFYNYPHEKGECPIVLVSGLYKVKNPRLSDFNFGKIIAPQDIWTMLSNWLLYTPEIVDSRDDNQKILSAGFDLKTSFRKM